MKNTFNLGSSFSLEEQIKKIEDDTNKSLLRIYISLSITIAVLILMIAVNANAEEYQSGKEMTKSFEGFSSNIYQCSVGLETIGYGFNVSATSEVINDKGIVTGRKAMSKDKADEVFEVVYSRSVEDARKYLGDSFSSLNTERQEIIIDMAYNLGFDRLSKFKKLKKAIISGDYALASKEMKNSDWYKQTGNRAKHHVNNFGVN